MQNEVWAADTAFMDSLCGEYRRHNQIDPADYERYQVKRGLRNPDGTGVMAGVTQIGSVMGYYVQDGERVPAPGKLIYRGIDVEALIDGFVGEGRFGFEETAYLLLMGSLPTRAQLEGFQALLNHHHTLPPMFTEDMIIKAPSPDVMNKLARSVLALYSYDDNPDDLSLANQLRQAVGLIARVPTIVAHAFAVKRHYYDNESLYLHRPQEGLSVAENFLYSVRHDNQYTAEEARLLDLCLVLHAEHGGGNNSAFTCRVLSSSGTDFYSAIAAAVGSLKGPRHGGANKKVMEMFGGLEADVKDWADDDAVRDYLPACCGRRRETARGSSTASATPSIPCPTPGRWCSSASPASWPRARACWRSSSCLSGWSGWLRRCSSPSRGRKRWSAPMWTSTPAWCTR